MPVVRTVYEIAMPNQEYRQVSELSQSMQLAGRLRRRAREYLEASDSSYVEPNLPAGFRRHTS
jgi:hypothetical protein